MNTIRAILIQVHGFARKERYSIKTTFSKNNDMSPFYVHAFIYILEVLCLISGRNDASVDFLSLCR
jgi:hypothetical protein